MAEQFDVTARRFHQWCVVGLSALAFVLGGAVGGALMVALGIVMVGGRFRDELDLFRQLYRVALLPTGLLRPHQIVEDRATRRVARVLGGSVQIAAGLLIAAGAATGAAWLLIGLISVMIALDASLDFCVLCFAVHAVRRAA